MRTLMRGGIGAFIVVGFCLPSLQPKLCPCRTLPLGIQNVVDKLFFREQSMVLRCSPKILPMLCPILIGPLFYHGFHTKDGLDFLLALGHRPVRPTRLGPSGLAFYFYPLHVLVLQKERNKCSRVMYNAHDQVDLRHLFLSFLLLRTPLQACSKTFPITY